jgi:hypothetical protein
MIFIASMASIFALPTWSAAQQPSLPRHGAHLATEW